MNTQESARICNIGRSGHEHVTRTFLNDSNCNWREKVLDEDCLGLPANFTYHCNDKKLSEVMKFKPTIFLIISLCAQTLETFSAKEN